MQAFHLLSWKTLLGSLLLLIILGLAPDSLFSQVATDSSESVSQAKSQLPATQSARPETPAAPVRRPARAPTSPLPGRSPTSPKQAPKVSAEKLQSDVGTFRRPSLITQAVLLSLMSVLPFIIMILTSFLKIVVVLSLLRSALGVQQAPPNQVINGVAFLLSLFIMYPTILKMYDSAQVVIHQKNVPDSFLAPDSSVFIIEVAEAAAQPFKDFLKRNSTGRHQALFFRLIYRGLPDEFRETLKPDDIIVLIPAYITGQLKEAFEIGVLIYIPFFVIDLVTSNILLAMGMMMLSPVTISMPLKLFLLVMLDGWTILIDGLVKTFQ